MAENIRYKLINCDWSVLHSSCVPLEKSHSLFLCLKTNNKLKKKKPDKRSPVSLEFLWVLNELLPVQVLLNCMELRKYWISFRDVEGELKLFTCPRIPSGICLRHYQTFSGLDEGFNICNSYIFLTPVTWSCPPPTPRSPAGAVSQLLRNKSSFTEQWNTTTGLLQVLCCFYSSQTWVF